MRKFGLSSAFVMLVLFSMNNISAYQTDFYFEDDGASNHTVQPPSLYWTEDCEVDFDIFVTTEHTGSYNLNNKWYSPDSIQVLFSNPTYTSNKTCLYQGTGTSTTDLNDFYETHTTTLTTATSTETWVNASYTCDPDSDNLFIYTNTTTEDSFGYYPYVYSKEWVSDCDVPADACKTYANSIGDVVDELQEGFYTPCGTGLRKDYFNIDTVGCTFGNLWSQDHAIFLKFNSMATGTINLSIAQMLYELSGSVSSVTYTDYVALWDTSTNSTTLLTALDLPYSINNLGLTENVDYWLIIYSCVRGAISGGNVNIRYQETDYNLSTWGYEPDYDCTDWSVCDQSFQTRICTDLGGIVGDFVDTRSCFLFSDFENLRGFEDFITNTTYTCQRDWTCSLYLADFEIKYPKGWSVSNIYDPVTNKSRDYFMEISDETSTEGTKSLKMWYVPPKEFEPMDFTSTDDPVPDDGNTSCGNLTIGKFPETNTPYNDTHFVATNVSFPSDFIDIRFDVKKCDNIVQQYGEGQGICYIIFDEHCYGNCNSTPSGKFGARLADADSGELIYDYTPTSATNDWKTHIMILDGLIEAGKNYTFALAVNPSNVFDPNPHCVYFDNVKYTTRNLEIDCTSRCDPDTFNYFKASLSEDGICSFELQTFSPFCVSANISEQVGLILNGTADGNTVCDGTTLRTFDKNTGKWDIIPNSPSCIKIVEDAIVETSVLDPPPFLQGFFPDGTLLWFLFSTASIVTVIALLTGGFLAYFTQWQFGTIGFIVVIALSTAGGFYPIWVGVAIVVISGGIFGLALKNVVS